MSTIVFLKDHPPQKKGAIVSVPFGVGRQLLAAGIARYFDEAHDVLPAPVQEASGVPETQSAAEHHAILSEPPPKKAPPKDQHGTTK